MGSISRDYWCNVDAQGRPIGDRHLHGTALAVWQRNCTRVDAVAPGDGVRIQDFEDGSRAIEVTLGGKTFKDEPRSVWWYLLHPQL